MPDPGPDRSPGFSPVPPGEVFVPGPSLSDEPAPDFSWLPESGLDCGLSAGLFFVSASLRSFSALAFSAAVVGEEIELKANGEFVQN